MAASIVFKIENNGDFRRFTLAEPLRFADVLSTVEQVFQLDGSERLRLVYTDQDGDAITLSSDEELAEARAASADKGVLRLRLLPSSQPLGSAAAEEPAPPSCWCDACSRTIRPSDVRFKCGNCANFDLCEQCEALASHDPSHVLLKLRPEAQAANGPLPTTAPLFSAPIGRRQPSSSPPPPDLSNVIESTLKAVQAQDFARMATASANNIDLSALVGMASSFLPALQQGQPAGGIGSAINSILSQLAQPAAAPTPAPAPTQPESPQNEQSDDAHATLIAMGVDAEMVDQLLVAADGDVNVAFSLWQTL